MGCSPWGRKELDTTECVRTVTETRWRVVPKSGRGSSFSAWETIRLLVIGTWRDGRDGEGRTYLQQKLQAAAESV